eukprot:TRINITY_DN1073_c0_g2_i1.p1 TRINITY_DN1073_c0_g2~~TRINITY_DN1073_c0_g2_i1.p1  ORF type:complete len:351 (+),score=50.19 TRINITY_DN1073_c0_g2_i1:52-1104(+)
MARVAVVFALLALLMGAILTEAASLNGLRVRGNTIVNGNGEVVKLRGVNHSGSEYACIGGYGILEGPTDAAAIQTIASWRANIVRVPLNADCWLGINGVKPQYGGSAYQSAISGYVQRLSDAGFAVILDLHWTAPGGTPAKGQTPMPDRDHAPTFWQQVASQYKSRTNVIFDLFNEPYPDNNAWDSTAAWTCWRDGGSCAGVGFQVAGMQELVNAVRGTGAPNVLMLGGIMYSNSLTQWWNYKPNDPMNNIVASWHSYNFNECNNANCWNNVVGPLASRIPVIAGEIGENDCTGNFITPMMQWMDSRGMHYLGWTWNVWNCNSGPALITDYNGSPTGFGAAYKAHLQSQE